MSGTEDLTGRRFAECVSAFGIEGEYDPACCRFPKSCSPYPYREAIEAGNVAEADLEPPRPRPTADPLAQRPWWACTGDPCTCPKPNNDPALLAELDGVPGADAPRVELANIRRLLERHGVAPADGHGVIRSTVGMVEEALIARPPSP